MISLISARRFLAPVSLCLLAMAAASCAGKPDYDKLNANAAKLATPPHNLSAYDYPFDDDGTYRKDWVTNKNATRGKRWRPATTSPPPPQPSTPPQAPMVASSQQQLPPPPRQPTYAPPPPSITPPQAPRPSPPPAAAPKPAARYHTVAKGDTLYSISRRYGATVPQLKSTNGLTSDVIRIGQTLRLP
ncbi:MAG: LysM peptidoglycan-binding domain-containing protein [Verrucomicrobiae bacterium]|nr:LysM peptidoglycan-binding domain-containing protein [Verrucomicrobiae bacterium]